jgi:hypothetical protein
MTVPLEEASANSVPAAAVIRRRQALSGITGRKGCVGGLMGQLVKSSDSIGKLHLKLSGLRVRGESGTRGVAVECVDIARNADGEGSSLVCFSYEKLMSPSYLWAD